MADNPSDIRTMEKRYTATRVTIEIETEDGGYLKQIFIDGWEQMSVSIHQTPAVRKGAVASTVIHIPRWPFMEDSHPGRNRPTKDVEVDNDLL